MLKIIAIIFGIIMILVGVLGFFPEATPDGLLLGLFAVNPPHNWIHIITGAAALLCGLASEQASRLFFQTFGIVYGLVALIGLFYGNAPILGIVANNIADVILHFIIAGFSLYLGFGCCGQCKTKHHHEDENLPPRDRDL